MQAFPGELLAALEDRDIRLLVYAGRDNHLIEELRLAAFDVQLPQSLLLFIADPCLHSCPAGKRAIGQSVRRSPQGISAPRLLCSDLERLQEKGSP